MQATSYPAQPGVPGQTVYVHQPAPVTNYATTVQNPNSTSGVSQNFNGAAGRATGWLQLFLGIGSIVVAIGELVLHTGVGYVAFGIWAAVLFYIPTGILGICSMKKNTCVIIGYLTMSIITANVAFGQMIAGAIGAGVISNYLGYCDVYYDFYCDLALRNGRIASDSLLAILGLIEMIVAIVASAYCCGGMACGQSSTRTTTTTVYTQQTTPMVVTTGQYAQPTGIAQPPPAYNAQQAYPQVAQPAPQAGYNQATPAPYSQQATPYNQQQATPYNQQQAAAVPTKPGGMVA